MLAPSAGVDRHMKTQEVFAVLVGGGMDRHPRQGSNLYHRFRRPSTGPSADHSGADTENRNRRRLRWQRDLALCVSACWLLPQDLHLLPFPYQGNAHLYVLRSIKLVTASGVEPLYPCSQAGGRPLSHALMKCSKEAGIKPAAAWFRARTSTNDLLSGSCWSLTSLEPLCRRTPKCSATASCSSVV
jgi:hypothetical protein